MAERESPYLWSITALTNGSVDPSINFLEFQLPSTVNNSARSLMSGVARYTKDNDGSLTTAGSANAFTLTINGTQTAYATGQRYSFKASFSNTGASTLNITNADAAAIGAKAIRVIMAYGESDLPANAIRSGGRYDVIYDSAANSAAGAFILLNPTVVSGAGALVPGGRVTLTSGPAITTADVTGATSIFYTPDVHDIVDIYDGTNWVPFQFAELTLALDSNSGHTGYQQSGKAFHVVVFLNSGTVTLGTGVAWTSDTSTGTGAGTAETELFQGRLVNKNAMTVRFGSSSGNTVSVAARQARIVGGIYMTANGQTEDSLIKRYTSNLHNAVERPMVAPAADASWAVSSATFIQANSNTANQYNYFHVVGGRELQALLLANSTGTSATKGFYVVGIGIDSTTVNSANAGFVPGNSDNTLYAPCFAAYKGYPGIGKHSIVYLEEAISANRTAQGTSQYAISGTTAN